MYQAQFVPKFFAHYYPIKSLQYTYTLSPNIIVTLCYKGLSACTLTPTILRSGCLGCRCYGGHGMFTSIFCWWVVTEDI